MGTPRARQSGGPVRAHGAPAAPRPPARRALALAGAGLALALAAPHRRAAAEELPARWEARPLTLPAVRLRLDLDVVYERLAAGVPAEDGLVPSADGDRVHAQIGLGVGLTDRLEVGAAAQRPAGLGGALPLQLSPEARVRAPSLYATLRLLDSALELAVRLDAWIPVGDDPFHMLLGLPFRAHLGSLVRLDGGLFLETDFDAFGDGIVPLAVGVQLSDEVFVQAESGVRFPGPSVPLELGMGTTFAHRGVPLFDLLGAVRFPDLREGVGAWQIWIRLEVFVTAYDPTPEPPPPSSPSRS